MNNNSNNRIIVINHEKCKPKTPVFDYLVARSKTCDRGCIQKEDKKIIVSEDACMICFNIAKRAPGEAIKVVRLPVNLNETPVHCYGTNSFKLHGLPTPPVNKVLGLLGINGIGKSTAIKILSGKIIPNFGNCNKETNKKEIIKYYRGTDLQKYFTKLYKKMVISIKTQDLETYRIDKLVKDTIKSSVITKKLELDKLMNNNIKNLSGGELQRLAIAITVSKKADAYFFDEPTSYLDFKQRLTVTEIIRSLLPKYVVVIEHDLSILDYISDNVQIIYGKPGVYGVVTKKTMPSNGINQFMNGYIINDNIRFRPYPLTFKTNNAHDIKITQGHSYPIMKQTFYQGFSLNVEEGGYMNGEIVSLMGQNGCGKTTFFKILEKYFASVKHFNSSIKKQEVFFKYDNNVTVQDVLEEKINSSLSNRNFRLIVLKPLAINNIKSLPINSLSGGEKQRVAVALCLGKNATIYLLDEPSAGLDCEQRIVVAKVIRKWVIDYLGKACFIIEHDFLMTSTITDKIITFSGIPGIKTTAHSPVNLKDGFNKFLKQLDITFRRDSENYRPRINKINSTKDKEQKKNNLYFSFNS